MTTHWLTSPLVLSAFALAALSTVAPSSQAAEGLPPAGTSAPGQPPERPSGYPSSASPADPRPMAYPPGYTTPPGYAPPGYPVQTYEAVEPTESEAPAPEVAPLRPFRFRVDFGMGGFDPSDVNAYLESRVPKNASRQSGFSQMVLLVSAGVSGAYYPTRYFGIRPNLVYLASPKVTAVDSNVTETYLLHSLAPGLSLDLAFDEGKLARYFFSPGLSYHAAWFEGYSASGLGISAALGADLSFGVARKMGISLALVLRLAKLDAGSRPADAPVDAPLVRTLDFSSLLFCVGFQLGR